MANRVLGTFEEKISDAAKSGSNVGCGSALGHSVDKIDEDGIIAAGERIAGKTVIWTAGVAPSPAGKWLTVETDRAGRVRVQPDFSVPGHPEIFVVGDTASLDQDGKPLPGVAQVAMQQGRYAGKLIHRTVTGNPRRRPFRYFDKGNWLSLAKISPSCKAGKSRSAVFWHGWPGRSHLEFLAQSTCGSTCSYSGSGLI